jgi:hypothetical protein
MKKLFISALLIHVVINAYGQERPLLYTGSYWEGSITGAGIVTAMYINTENNKIVFRYAADSLKEGSYVITGENGMNYLVILWDDATWEKYLMLAGGDCFLYNSDGEPYFAGILTNPEYKTDYPGPITLTKGLSASTSLVEGSTVYSVDNLDARIGVCWAEGSRGQGINEKIIIKGWAGSRADISIGFVSYEKPQLYRENSRPKKIGKYLDGKLVALIELEDTPNFQPLGAIDGNCELVILEVYEGTKYQDTCINAIIFIVGQ